MLNDAPADVSRTPTDGEPQTEPEAKDMPAGEPQSTTEAADAHEPEPAAGVVDTHEASTTATPISELIPRHPLVPVFCIGLPILAVGVFGLERQTVIAVVAAVVLTILAAIDIEHRILPNRIVVPATGVILALQLILFPGDYLQWLLAGLAAAAFLAAPLIFRRDAMGMGDIKLAVLLGTIVGWDVFGAIVVGCFAIVPIAIWMRVREGSIKGATLPFGPFLAFGTLVILFTS